jgi:hypothetical protein
MDYEGFAFSDAAGQWRMFASWFAQWAILRYLDSPRTTLIGHPATAADTGAEGLTPRVRHNPASRTKRRFSGKRCRLEQMCTLEGNKVYSTKYSRFHSSPTDISYCTL